jgi:membrane protein
MNRLWTIVRDAATGFAADNCLSRGAAIAYYTVFSVAPLLVIAITIAGLVFGDEAARGAVAEQLRGMLGDDAAEAVETMIQGASDTGRGTLATLIGVGGLLLAASGTFTELQSALNAIWKTETPQSESGGAVQAVSRFVRAKAAAMGLVAATGFLLLVSLVVSASVAAFTTWMGHIFPGAAVVGPILAFAVSFVFVTAMFAAVYKVLPDRHLEWRDVLVGAAATSLP